MCYTVCTTGFHHWFWSITSCPAHFSVRINSWRLFSWIWCAGRKTLINKQQCFYALSYIQFLKYTSGTVHWSGSNRNHVILVAGQVPRARKRISFKARSCWAESENAHSHCVHLFSHVCVITSGKQHEYFLYKTAESVAFKSRKSPTSVMDPTAVTGSAFNGRYIVMAYNDDNFSEPTRLPFNRSAEQSTVSEKTSVIIAVSITAVYSAICVLGLLGNVLVMYGVVRYESFLLHRKQQEEEQNLTALQLKLVVGW